MGLNIFGIPIEVWQGILTAGAIGKEQVDSDELIKKDEARFAEGTGLQKSGLARLVEQSKGLTNQVTGGFGALRQRTLAELAQVGGQEKTDINRRFGALQSRSAQDLTSRGLGSSTILSSTSAGIERQRSDSLGSLADRLRQARANADERITGNQLGAQASLGSQAIGTEVTLLQSLANSILNRSDIQPFNPFAAGVQGLEFLKPPPKPEGPKEPSFIERAFAIGAGMGSAIIPG